MFPQMLLKTGRLHLCAPSSSFRIRGGWISTGNCCPYLCKSQAPPGFQPLPAPLRPLPPLPPSPPAQPPLPTVLPPLTRQLLITRQGLKAFPRWRNIHFQIAAKQRAQKKWQEKKGRTMEKVKRAHPRILRVDRCLCLLRIKMMFKFIFLNLLDAFLQWSCIALNIN